MTAHRIPEGFDFPLCGQKLLNPPLIRKSTLIVDACLECLLACKTMGIPYFQTEENDEPEPRPSFEDNDSVDDPRYDNF